MSVRLSQPWMVLIQLNVLSCNLACWLASASVTLCLIGVPVTIGPPWPFLSKVTLAWSLNICCLISPKWLKVDAWSKENSTLKLEVVYVLHSNAGIKVVQGHIKAEVVKQNLRNCQKSTLNQYYR